MHLVSSEDYETSNLQVLTLSHCIILKEQIHFSKGNVICSFLNLIYNDTKMSFSKLSGVFLLDIEILRTKSIWY